MEVFSRTSTGSTIVCGLGLAGRVGREPVADMMLFDLVSYLHAAKQVPPHPLFSAGDVIHWGANYSSERGVAYSSPSGLIIQPCPFDAGCRLPNQGYRACGRLPFGPFTWSIMG